MIKPVQKLTLKGKGSLCKNLGNLLLFFFLRKTFVSKKKKPLET